MTTHTLKTIDICWDAVASGEKTFEVRKNDRFFQRGDTVVLRKIEGPAGLIPGAVVTAPDGGMFSTCDLTRRIGWILQGGQFGIELGYIVFSLEPDSTP